jgi:hypothetical protein
MRIQKATKSVVKRKNMIYFVSLRSFSSSFQKYKRKRAFETKWRIPPWIKL